ncbi:hypothetical protein [Candidatus Mesenet endosymbiont of Agriotes lineatus]|uniref:hypothetical protein n=1 Tax=Candidatus Mesenet endosymbiont of Agriotes lineatus TaxID=3077948 RepID=UPI0030D3F958
MIDKTNNKNENIQNTNQTNVDNTQVDQGSVFSELPFFEHSEFDDIEVVNTDNVHLELDGDDDSDDDKNTSVGQIDEIQSPASTEYATPLEHSESDAAKIVSDDDHSVRQEDDNDTDERELEDKSKPEKRSDSIPNIIPFFDSEDLSTDDTSKPELKDDSKLAEEKTVCKEENKHEITGTNSESRKVSLSDGESLTGDNSDSSTPHTQTSRVSEGSSTSSGINHNTSKKKVSKSPFANFSKGEKALLLFVTLSSAAFIASFISSVLGKPLCPDKKGNLISLAILGTIAIILVTVSLFHFHYPDKPKGESLPLSALGDGKIAKVSEDKKHV